MSEQPKLEIWYEVGNDGHPEPGTPVWVRLKLSAPGKNFSKPEIAMAASKRRGVFWKFLKESNDESISDYDLWTWIESPPYSDESLRSSR